MAPKSSKGPSSSLSLLLLLASLSLCTEMGSAANQMRGQNSTSSRSLPRTSSSWSQKLRRLGSSRKRPLPLEVNAVCKNLPGLRKEQAEVCSKFPDATLMALRGFQVALDECQRQFRNDRWNCSSLHHRYRNPHTSPILKKGYRESAFAHAISTAGVVHAVSRACSSGDLLSCGCGSAEGRRRGRGRNDGQLRWAEEGSSDTSDSSWKWAGCAHNLDFGLRFSRVLLDSREKAKDLHSQTILHNNQVGRMAVTKNMEVKCKCHGLSGSCELKTCWQVTPPFGKVGEVLKQRYTDAVLVDQGNAGQRPFLMPRRKRRRLYGARLLYYEKSPNFCEPDPKLDFKGTQGRRCNRTSDGADGCDSMCCGRGYNTIRERRVQRCNCRFQWCCQVVCQNCTLDHWVTECK